VRQIWITQYLSASFPKEIAVGSQPNKSKRTLDLQVDEHKIGLDVAIPESGPFADQGMVVQACRENGVRSKERDDLAEDWFEVAVLGSR
jgi:hypothetical protein